MPHKSILDLTLTPTGHKNSYAGPYSKYFSLTFALLGGMDGRDTKNEWE